MHNTLTPPTKEVQTHGTKPATRKVRRRPRHMSLDARTWQFALLKKTREELLTHIGPSPSITQKALAERAAWLTVYVAELDARVTAGAFMTEHDSRQYLAWSNSLARCLARIGPQAAAQKQPDLRSYIARPAGEAAAT